MKYNTTYTPTGSLKQTINFTNDVWKKIVTYFEKQFDVTRIMAPKVLPDNSAYNLEIEEKTRSVNFDTLHEFKVAHLALSDTPYLRKMIHNLDFKANEGLFSENTFVWRDVEESPVSTILKYELTLQVVYESNSKNYISNVAKDLYRFIFTLAHQAEKQFGVQNILPQIASFISAQNLENEYLDKDFKTREIEMILEKDAFIFENPGKKLLTGQTHTELPGAFYNLEKFYQIVLKDRINSHVLKVASVSEIAMGSVLADQIANNIILKQVSEYIALSKSDKKILEIKINLPRLIMALLGKGHISEVQPGVYSSEERVVKSRYKVDAY